MEALRIKIEIPQKKDYAWKVATALPGKPAKFSKKKTAISCYRFAESRIKRYMNKTSKVLHSSGTPHDHKTAVWVKDGILYNNGEYTDYKTTLYALAAFLEDYLADGFIRGRYKRYYTGV